jgi:hypothetical protein
VVLIRKCTALVQEEIEMWHHALVNIQGTFRKHSGNIQGTFN